MADFLHGVFVLGSLASVVLPLREAATSKSPFYLCLFGSLAIVSFASHCEETGICPPISIVTMARLEAVHMAVSYYLLSVMLLVVLEVRAELLGRLVTGVWTLIMLAHGVRNMPFNVIGTAVLCGIIFAVDATRFKRNFSAAWWRRLALIGAMAAGGAVLFRFLKLLWAWHGIWHIYYMITCYLLLVAQRHKRMAIAEQRAARLGGDAASTLRKTGILDPYTSATPLKRKPQGVATSTAVMGAAAPALPHATSHAGGANSSHEL